MRNNLNMGQIKREETGIYILWVQLISAGTVFPQEGRHMAAWCLQRFCNIYNPTAFIDPLDIIRPS